MKNRNKARFVNDNEIWNKMLWHLEMFEFCSESCQHRECKQNA
jgi:hypothetical protein